MNYFRAMTCLSAFWLCSCVRNVCMYMTQIRHLPDASSKWCLFFPSLLLSKVDAVTSAALSQYALFCLCWQPWQGWVQTEKLVKGEYGKDFLLPTHLKHWPIETEAGCTPVRAVHSFWQCSHWCLQHLSTQWYILKSLLIKMFFTPWKYCLLNLHWTQDLHISIKKTAIFFHYITVGSLIMRVLQMEVLLYMFFIVHGYALDIWIVCSILLFL